MRITFFASSKPREQMLASAFLDGARVHGDEVLIKDLTGEAQVAETEVAVMVGVKSRELFHANWAAGVHTVYLDKGYIRGRGESPAVGWEYWRVAVDGHHPTRHLARMRCPSDRWDRFGIPVAPWRRRGEQIVFAGSSAKYHEFYGLVEPTQYAKKMRNWIRERDNDRLIVYRPKPSWRDARPVPGMEYSGPGHTLAQCLDGAHALVTHGSNACFEAVVAGVPCIVVGEAVAKPISSTTMDELESPRLASDDERGQWLSNLAYLQWTLREIASGEMWSNLRSQVYG